MKRYICLMLYYSIAYWLPESYKLWGAGTVFRRFLCKRIFKLCGKNVNIERRACFGSGRYIEIGDNSGIGVGCNVPPDIIIGDNVMMAPQSYFLPSRSHKYDSTDIPMCQQGTKENGRIIIEDDCWIGLRCIVTAGRVIKKGTIVAAGTVLVKDFPPYSIVGGNPSRLIKSRH